MNPTLLLISFCFWLLAPAMPAPAATFNVTDYGAVGTFTKNGGTGIRACWIGSAP